MNVVTFKLVIFVIDTHILYYSKVIVDFQELSLETIILCIFCFVLNVVMYGQTLSYEGGKLIY